MELGSGSRRCADNDPTRPLPTLDVAGLFKLRSTVAILARSQCSQRLAQCFSSSSSSRTSARNSSLSGRLLRLTSQSCSVVCAGPSRGNSPRSWAANSRSGTRSRMRCACSSSQLCLANLTGSSPEGCDSVTATHHAAAVSGDCRRAPPDHGVPAPLDHQPTRKPPASWGECQMRPPPTRRSRGRPARVPPNRTHASGTQRQPADRSLRTARTELVHNASPPTIPDTASASCAIPTAPRTTRTASAPIRRRGCGAAASTVAATSGVGSAARVR